MYRTSGDGINGYLGSLKKLKSKPLRLSLPNEIIEKYGMSEIEFTKAKFDNIHQQAEKYIITTIREILIVWKLEDVFEGKNEPKVSIKLVNDS